jgi:ribosomal RNA-processing protein 17
MLPSVKKRKHSAPIVEEVKFDDDARADYLTGFHKRKVQRVKHAQEQAVKQDKAERIEARKRVSVKMLYVHSNFLTDSM